MANYKDLIAAASFAEKFRSQFGLNSAIDAVIASQAKWTNSLSGINIHESIAKSIGQHQYFNSKAFLGLDSIAKSAVMQSRFNIPSTVFDTISAINLNHEKLFGSLRGINAIIEHNKTFAHIRNLQSALVGVSGQFAVTASINKRWDLLEDFEEISNEAFAINEKIIDNEGITTESLAEIKNLLERIEIKTDKIDADASNILWKFFTIISLILALVGEIRNWTPKPNFATKEEVEAAIKEQFSIAQSKLKTHKEYRTTNRVCKVRLKPTTKTQSLATLPIGFDVIVLQVNHKWIYVSYTNPNDNLPQTGWILKKYLTQPK